MHERLEAAPERPASRPVRHAHSAEPWSRSMSRRREIAKFACGAEAFHAVVHAYFWFSGTTLRAFGIRQNPKWHRASAIGNGVVSLILGMHAWGPHGRPAA